MTVKVLSLTVEPVSACLATYPRPATQIKAMLGLRRQQPAPEATALLSGALQQLPHQRRYLTPQEVAATTGSYPADVAALEAYFTPFNIQLTHPDLLLGHVTLGGSVADFEQAFRAEIGVFQTAGQAQFLAFTTPYFLPQDLVALLRPNQPQQYPVRKESRPLTRPLPVAAMAAEPTSGYSVVALGRAYQFPADATGAGQVIGIVELGGKLNQDDVKQFFSQLGLRKPQIKEVGTPPNTLPSGNAEVALDLQIVGALAPQAKLVVYYGATLIQALQAVLSDTANNPTVLSISWSGSESAYSPAEVEELSVLLYQASLLGITVVASSGDYGAYNHLLKPNVPLPTSNPWVLGCGGTIATLAGTDLASEVVWNEQMGATGGGYSSLYTQPLYQAQAVANYYPALRLATRGVPDVAANASGLHGYQIVFGGQPQVLGGTSAATPFVAALLALLGEKLNYRLGFLNAVLYSLAGSEVFRPIVCGNNQFYPAAPYWNPCTGLGSLVGTNLLEALRMLEQTYPAVPPAAADEAAGTSASEETSLIS